MKWHRPRMNLTKDRKKMVGEDTDHGMSQHQQIRQVKKFISNKESYVLL